MLTLTQNATSIVEEITGQPGLPDTAGLRITHESDGPDEAGLAVSAAEAGQPGDEVVQQGGARVYLDAAAAELLDDKVLDAAVDPTGKVEFALGLQAGAAG